MVKFLAFMLGGFLAVGAFMLLPSATTPDQLPVPSNAFLHQVVKPIDLNRSFELAGETIPMHNQDVLQRIDRELLINAYSHATTIINMKRAYEVFPVIERILAEEGIPDDFKYLAVAESNLVNQATSNVGAKGVWQFMEGTAREYNMEVNGEIDERLDLEKATRAACKYLRNAHNRYGSWIMAAASYNMGPSGLQRDASAQKMSKYWDINLNNETSRYVFRILAIKDIMSHPEAYGFFVENRHKYAESGNVVTTTVDTSVPSWVDFAITHGSSLRLLKFYNPWIVGGSLSNKSGKSYQVKIVRID